MFISDNLMIIDNYIFLPAKWPDTAKAKFLRFFRKSKLLLISNLFRPTNSLAIENAIK